MADAKQAPSNKGGEQIKAANPFKSIFPWIAIAVCAIAAHMLFYMFCGHPSNFENGEAVQEVYNQWVADGSNGEAPPAGNEGHPINFWGIVFKGGFVIPIGITLMFVMFTFTVERLFMLLMAKGKGNQDVFVKRVRMLVGKGDIDTAAKDCDKQRGSLGNVVKAGLRKYKEMVERTDIDKETRKQAIHDQLEEATMLELPSLERNLSIIATVASLGTLVGLIGTVIGMIKAFSALGAGGAPNAAELSVGISEALVNTAIGITTSALSILSYNFFTTQIDKMTYGMDEASYSIVSTFDIREK